MSWVTKSSQEEYEAPAEPRNYSKQEKAANWWHYQKWCVVVAIIAVILVAWIVKDTVFRVKPDYEVGYVGSSDLPPDTVTALETALADFGQDLNGDGQVVVTLNQFPVDFDGGDNTDVYYQMAGVAKLSADLSTNEGSYIFLIEDPEGFEFQTSALQYLDGSLPEAESTDWQNMVYRWSDCPVLAGLDLGEYTGLTVMDETTGESQDVLANLYVGLRGNWREDKDGNYQNNLAMWELLTAGATPLEESTF